MDIWLERLDKIIKIIRPKAYNVIARTIIGLGVVVVAESQLNIIQAIVVALYENYFGVSEILRSLIGGASNLWVGLFLIVIGLVYHYLMTVGKDQVETRLSLIPRQPNFELQLLNADLERFESKTVNLRGCLVNVPSNEEIPEYKLNYNLKHLDRLTSVLNTFGNTISNSKFYKERAEFLKVWGGSELITLKIFNHSERLVTGVEIAVRFPKINGVSADNTKASLPISPSNTIQHRYEVVSLASPHRSVHYDIKRNHTSEEYRFIWKAGEIQANTNKVSDTYIFLRLEQPIDVELTIFCDQLAAPLKETYHLIPNDSSLNVSIADLSSDDEQFNKLINSCVMNGYIQRETQKKISEFEHVHQELLPR